MSPGRRAPPRARPSPAVRSSGCSCFTWPSDRPRRPAGPLDEGMADTLGAVRSVLVGQHLCLRPSVGKKARLLALPPGGALLSAADVPVGTAALQDRAQVEAELLHRRPAEEP